MTLETDRIYQGDCLDLMREIPDKSIDLVLTDPPYGIGIASNPVRQMHAKKDWDARPPSREAFDEIFRISKEQVIWGGNYFDLPPSQGFLVWDKRQPEAFSLAMCEYAWCSHQSPAKIFRYSVLREQNKQHPTQKPVALMEWCIKRHSSPGDLVFDPFLGSGTTAVACIRLGRHYIGVEQDPEYFDIARHRIASENRQTRLISASEEATP